MKQRALHDSGRRIAPGRPLWLIDAGHRLAGEGRPASSGFRDARCRAGTSRLSIRYVRPATDERSGFRTDGLLVFSRLRRETRVDPAAVAAKGTGMRKSTWYTGACKRRSREASCVSLPCGTVSHQLPGQPWIREAGRALPSWDEASLAPAVAGWGRNPLRVVARDLACSLGLPYIVVLKIDLRSRSGSAPAPLGGR